MSKIPVPSAASLSHPFQVKSRISQAGAMHDRMTSLVGRSVGGDVGLKQPGRAKRDAGGLVAGDEAVDLTPGGWAWPHPVVRPPTCTATTTPRIAIVPQRACQSALSLVP